MAGFMAGLGQGFSGLPQALDRREMVKIRQAAEARQAQIEQKKATGDLIKQYSDAIQSVPEDQVPARTKLFFSQIENLTGQKVNPAVANIIGQDPAGAAKTMMQLYSDQPFDSKTLGKTLGDPAIFAGVYDAHNKRRMGMEAAAAFSGSTQMQGQGGSGPGVQSFPVAPQSNLGGSGGIGGGGPGNRAPGVFDVSAMEDKLEQINQQIAAIGGQAGGDPETMKIRLGSLQAQADAIDKRIAKVYEHAEISSAGRLGINLAKASPQQRQLVQQEALMQMGLAKGAETAGARRETGLSLEETQALPGTPFGTTKGQIEDRNAGGGGVGTQPMAGIPTGPSAVTPQILDNLRQVESGGDRFAINKKTKALGPYQFLPETFVDMQRRGIVFNPLDEKQSRAAAEQYLNVLVKQNGGDMRKALAAYGGFVTKDPTSYVNKVMGGGGGGAAPASNVPLSQADLAQQEDMAKGIGKQFQTWQENTSKASGKLKRAEILKSYLEKVDTGALAGSVLQIQRLAQGIGFNVPDSASYAESAKALGKAMAMEMRDPSEGAGSPGQISEWEAKNFEMMVPNIDKLPGANRLLIDAYINNQKRALDIAKLQREYVRDNGGKVDNGVYAIAEQYREANPIVNEADMEKVLRGADKLPESSIKSKVKPFDDSDKEKRYQEWKRSQGK